MKKGTLALAAVAIAAAAPVAAWDSKGHMIIAARAWEQLSPESKVAVGRLLQHNPSYARWTASVAPADRSRAAFVQAATWPDDIKFDSNYHGDESTPPSDGSAIRNSGYDDCLRHKYWHYEDIPYSADRPSGRMPDTRLDRRPPSPNAETQIDAFARTLARTDPAASDQLKSYDLVWLIHLVGDVHQPLHATSRFIATDRNGDNGGLDVRISCSERRCSGLHSYWDGALDALWDATDAHRPDFERARLALPPGLAPDPAAAANLSRAKWLRDSFDLATTEVYRAPIGDTLGRFTIDDAYRDNAARVAQRQAVLAAARLANVINLANVVVHGDPPFTGRCVAGRFQPGPGAGGGGGSR